MKASYQCAKTLDHYSLWAHVFLFKSLNVFNLPAATKNQRTNYTFFVKPTCFLLIQETRRSMTNF